MGIHSAHARASTVEKARDGDGDGLIYDGTAREQAAKREARKRAKVTGVRQKVWMNMGQYEISPAGGPPAYEDKYAEFFVEPNGSVVQKAKEPRDGDGDGMVYDGTSRERPARISGLGPVGTKVRETARGSKRRRGKVVAVNPPSKLSVGDPNERGGTIKWEDGEEERVSGLTGAYNPLDEVYRRNIRPERDPVASTQLRENGSGRLETVDTSQPGSVRVDPDYEPEAGDAWSGYRAQRAKRSPELALELVLGEGRTTTAVERLELAEHLLANAGDMLDDGEQIAVKQRLPALRRAAEKHKRQLRQAELLGQHSESRFNKSEDGIFGLAERLVLEKADRDETNLLEKAAGGLPSLEERITSVLEERNDMYKAQTDVESHTRRSTRGKLVRVKSYKRDIVEAALKKLASGGTLELPDGRQIKKNEDGVLQVFRPDGSEVRMQDHSKKSPDMAAYVAAADSANSKDPNSLGGEKRYVSEKAAELGFENPAAKEMLRFRDVQSEPHVEYKNERRPTKAELAAEKKRSRKWSRARNALDKKLAEQPIPSPAQIAKKIKAPEGFTKEVKVGMTDQYGREWGTKADRQVILTHPDGTKIVIDLPKSTGLSHEPYSLGSGHVHYKIADGREYSFDRHGVEDSFYVPNPRKAHDEMDVNPIDSTNHAIEEFVTKKIPSAKARLEDSEVVPSIGFSVSPESKKKITEKLEAGKHHEFFPSGFGTGYYISRSPIRGGKKGPKALADFFGVDVIYVSSFDAD